MELRSRNCRGTSPGPWPAQMPALPPPVLSHGMGRRRMAWAQRYDMDGSGDLDRDELRNMLEDLQ